MRRSPTSAIANGVYSFRVNGCTPGAETLRQRWLGPAVPRQIAAMSTEHSPDPLAARSTEPVEPGPDPAVPPPIPERPVPRGCNPLVFGVAMATIQLGCTVYLMRSC